MARYTYGHILLVMTSVVSMLRTRTVRRSMHRPTTYRSGVGIVLVNHRGLVLAARRKDGRTPPWQMPQGGIQGAETPEDAALRELTEELGTAKAEIIGTHPDWLRYDYPTTSTSARATKYRGQQHRWFLMRFTGEDRDIVVHGDHAEFDAWQWMTPSAIADAVVAFKRQVYRDVMAHFTAAFEQLAATHRTALPNMCWERPAWRPDCASPARHVVGQDRTASNLQPFPTHTHDNIEPLAKPLSSRL